MESFYEGFDENNDLIRKKAESFVTKENNRRTKKMTDWSIFCLKDWYYSMNKSFVLIFNCLSKKINFLHYIIENKINILLNSFIEKTNIDLKSVIKDVSETEKNKIWNWISEDYHPANFNDNILSELKKTKIKYKEEKFICWIKIMELYFNKENSDNKKELIQRYIKVIDELKIFIEL